MSLSNKTKGSVLAGAIGLLLVLGVSGNAMAATMKWCTKWKSTYVDAGHGEDVFTSSNAIKRKAKFTHAQVWRWEDGDHEKIWEGDLDADGCTPALSASSYTQYRFRQGTMAKRGSRRIFVNSDTGVYEPYETWPENYLYLNSYYTTAMLFIGGEYTHTFEPDWESPKGNVMPILGRILQKYNLYNYPSSADTIVRTDTNGYNDTCDVSGGAWCAGQNICLAGNHPDWDDVTTWKYIVAHEMGHRVSNATDGPDISNYYTEPYTNEECTCDHVTYGEDSHCLQSREPNDTAAAEGFAHFFATMVYNYRVENNGRFVNPKEAWIDAGEFFIVSHPT